VRTERLMSCDTKVRALGSRWLIAVLAVQTISRPVFGIHLGGRASRLGAPAVHA
jgi:hypothetical protein